MDPGISVIDIQALSIKLGCCVGGQRVLCGWLLWGGENSSSGSRSQSGCLALWKQIRSELWLKNPPSDALVELFTGHDKNFFKPQHQQDQAFENEVVEHVYFLVKREAKEIKWELCHPLSVMLGWALPHSWLTKEGLIKGVKLPWWISAVVPKEILDNVKPTVHFAASTKPEMRLHVTSTTPPQDTNKKLELHLQAEWPQAREKISLQRLLQSQRQQQSLNRRTRRSSSLGSINWRGGGRPRCKNKDSNFKHLEPPAYFFNSAYFLCYSIALQHMHIYTPCFSHTNSFRYENGNSFSTLFLFWVNFVNRIISHFLSTEAVEVLFL